MKRKYESPIIEIKIFNLDVITESEEPNESLDTPPKWLPID